MCIKLSIVLFIELDQNLYACQGITYIRVYNRVMYNKNSTIYYVQIFSTLFFTTKKRVLRFCRKFIIHSYRICIVFLHAPISQWIKSPIRNR